MIPKQSFSLLVVPESEGRSRNWHFELNFLKRAFWLGVTVVTLLALFFVHYLYLFFTESSRQALSAHNQALTLQLKQVEARLAPLEKELERVTRLSQKLQALATARPGSQPTIASSESDEPSLSLAWLQNQEAQALEATLLSEKASALSEELRKQTLTLSHLVDVFEEREERNALLPSLHPIKGFMTSPFGARADPMSGELAMHTGVDLAAAEGTVVIAPAYGRVVFYHRDGALGNLLVIDHGMGFQTQYGHLKASLVQVGDSVERGQPIAEVGSTGKSTGPHLHYEIRQFGIPIDPLQYMID